VPHVNVTNVTPAIRGRRAATALATGALLTLGAAIGGCSGSPTAPSERGLRAGRPLLQQGSQPADTTRGRDTTGGSTQGEYTSPIV
jgi:hypothetical protein